MTGKIIYDGIILDDSGNRYNFTQEDILNAQDFRIGAVVDFSADENGIAKAIVITQKPSNGFLDWLLNTNSSAIKSKLLIGFWIYLICHIVSCFIYLMTRTTNDESIIRVICDYLDTATRILSDCASFWLLFPILALSRASGNKIILPAFIAMVILAQIPNVVSLLGFALDPWEDILHSFAYMIVLGFYYIAFSRITGRKEFILALVFGVMEGVIYIIQIILWQSENIWFNAWFVELALFLPSYFFIIINTFYEILGTSKMSKIYKKGEPYQESVNAIANQTQEELKKESSTIASILLCGILGIVGIFWILVELARSKINLSESFGDSFLIFTTILTLITLVSLFTLIKSIFLVIKMNRSAESKVLLNSFLAIPLAFLLSAICSYCICALDSDITLNGYLAIVIGVALYISLVPYCLGVIELAHITNQKAFIVGLVFQIFASTCMLIFAWLLTSSIQDLWAEIKNQNLSVVLENQDWAADMLWWFIKLITAALVAFVISYISFIVGFGTITEIRKSEAIGRVISECGRDNQISATDIQNEISTRRLTMFGSIKNIYLRHLLYWVLGSLSPSILLSFLLPDLLFTAIFCVFFGLYLYCFGAIAYKFRGAYNDTLRIIAFIPLLNTIVIQFIVPKDTQTPTHAFLICFLQGIILLILNTLLFVPSIFYARYIVNRNKR